MNCSKMRKCLSPLRVESNLLFLQEDKSYYDYNWIKIQQIVAQITKD